jgi:hypothetical protein
MKLKLRDKNETPVVFIGYDDRQPKAYKVCEESIRDNCSTDVVIYPLDHKDLRRKGLFTREWGVNVNTGNNYDLKDDLPFSNHFSHTRFLTPGYSDWLGVRDPLVMFVDLDFIFLSDVNELFNRCDLHDNRHPIHCVKHEYNPENKLKMDQQVQTKYPRKLWTSLMMFDKREPEIGKELSIDKVNKAKLSDLHRLNWVAPTRIGEIFESWNFIPGHSESRSQFIDAIHYTEGLPNVPGYETSKYSRLYLEAEAKIK